MRASMDYAQGVMDTVCIVLGDTSNEGTKEDLALG